MSRPGGSAATAPSARSRVRRASPRDHRRRHVLGAESLEPRLAMSADVADAIATARVFSAGTSITGRIGDGAWKRRDVDLVGFKVATGGKLTADLDAKSLAGGSSLDGHLRVFDASGRVVAFNDDFAGSVDSFVSLTVPKAGTYYVGVSGSKNSAYNPLRAGSGRVGSTGRYSLTVGIENPPPVDGVGDTLETARDIGALLGSRTLRERVGGTDPADVYRVTFNDRTRLRLQLVSSIANAADLSLLDAAGNLIDTSTVTGTIDLIERDVRPGNYFVRAVSTGGPANYTLTLSASVVLPTFATPEYRATTGWGFVDAAAAVARVRGLGRPLREVPWQSDFDPWIDMVNAPAAWARGFTGAGVVVAVVDTGVDYDHHDLRRNIWVNPREIAGDGLDNDRNGFVDDVRGWDFADNDAAPMDVVHTWIDEFGVTQRNIGHGTHVAGTVAAVRNGTGVTGVAPDARIMPVRVFGQRNITSDAIIARGIRYAADNGAHVINMSLGGGPFSSEIELAILHARSRGCVVVICAGNWSEPTPQFPANLAAEIDGVIAVGATDDERSLAWFSNRAGSDPRMQYVTAPGVSILSTLPGGGFGWDDGTSMAAPHVAGVAALMRSALPTANQQRYWAHITGTARQLPAVTVRVPVTVTPDTAAARGQFAALAEGIVESDVRRRTARAWR